MNAIATNKLGSESTFGTCVERGQLRGLSTRQSGTIWIVDCKLKLHAAIQWAWPDVVLFLQINCVMRFDFDIE